MEGHGYYRVRDVNKGETNHDGESFQITTRLVKWANMYIESGKACHVVKRHNESKHCVKKQPVS